MREQRHQRLIGASAACRAGRPAAPMSRHAQRADDAADVADVRLDDVDRRSSRSCGARPADQQSCSPPVTSRSSASRTSLRLLELPVGAGLLEMRRRRGPAAGGRPRSRGAANSRYWRRPAGCASSPSALRMAGTISSVRPGHSSTSWPYSAPTRNLKASKPCASRRPRKRSASSPGRDVALHRRGIGPQAAGRAAEQLAHALAFELAAQIPQRGVEAAHGAAQVGARELVLALRDEVDQCVDVECVRAERPAARPAGARSGR